MRLLCPVLGVMTSFTSIAGGDLVGAVPPRSGGRRQGRAYLRPAATLVGAVPQGAAQGRSGFTAPTRLGVRGRRNLVHGLTPRSFRHASWPDMSASGSVRGGLCPAGTGKDVDAGPCGA